MSLKMLHGRIIQTFRNAIITACALLLIAHSAFSQNSSAQNTSLNNNGSDLDAITDTKNSAVLISKLPDSSLKAQRIEYTKAMEALNNGRKKDFKKSLAKLDNYPLKPYAEYSELKRRLSSFPYQEIDKFLDANKNSALGDQLTKNWLFKLAASKHWHDYQTYYESTTAGKSSAELSCYYLRSKVNTGDKSVLEKVEPLWNVGRSQPNACDPIFKLWISEGHLTPKIAWERFSKAISSKNRSLAQYVAKKMPQEMQQLAALYLEVDSKPAYLKNYRRFNQQSPEMHEIILHGIKRYARRSPEKALVHWERYNASHYLPAEERDNTREYLITQLAKKGHLDQAEKLLAKTSKVANKELTDWLARDALKSQDWKRLYNTLSLFSQEEQDSQRWLYWRARAMEELGISDPNYPNPEIIYASLALTRSFYGFMSADKLGREYTLVDRPVTSSNALFLKVANQPSMLRARELLVLGSLRNARREWWYATRNLEKAELIAAGQLAEQWGWHKKSIQSLIQARHWDGLQLRFPLAYEEEVRFAAKKTKIDPTLLFAIARQESAFAADARSPAGAMGLMQLMPATAKQTARKIGVRHTTRDLIKPSHNINLGSRYLDELLQQFDGNRILAAAAYNAGPNRVKRWLKNSEAEMPYDVWIETIPFRETRGYVQNVLSFSVIYGYRMGQQTPLLSKKETRLPGLGL
ncbi:MAG: transglycosylase SLT domain-containing protein [Cellvibrionaceae bacterium]